MNTSRIIKTAVEFGDKYGKSISLETRFDCHDKESFENIMAMSYAIGYIDAKKFSRGDWDNPFPTWSDINSILHTIWNKISNIPLYILARCGNLGNRKIAQLIKNQINTVLDDVCKYDNIKMSRNGLKMLMTRKMDDMKYKGLIKSYNVINNNCVDEDKCIWVNERGFSGYVEIELLNNKEIIKVNCDVNNL